MKIPTAEELSEYESRLQKVIAAIESGNPDLDAQKELKEFMQKTGIADEPPVTDFPELDEVGGES